jgi:hypothetical protein
LPGDVYRVLGYVAAGVVEAVGPEVTLFQSGDEVWYAVSIIRSGANAQFHLVDERIVAHKPKSLDFTHALALPLTGITAWELLFDRFGLQPGRSTGKGSLLIIGGAGGVGSILTCPPIDRSDIDLDEFATGDEGVVSGTGSQLCHRSHKAVRSAIEGDRCSRSQLYCRFPYSEMIRVVFFIPNTFMTLRSVGI